MGKVVALSDFESLRKVKSNNSAGAFAPRILLFTGIQYERLSESKIKVQDERLARKKSIPETKPQRRRPF